MSWHIILPKDYSHTSIYRSDLYVTDNRISINNLFTQHSVVTNRLGVLYGTALPFQAEQGNVFILLDIKFSRFTKSNFFSFTYKPKKRPFYNQNHKTFLFSYSCTIKQFIETIFFRTNILNFYIKF